MPIRLLKKLLAWTLLAIVIAVSVLIIQFFRFQHENVSINESGRTFTIEPGSNIKTIAHQLSLEKIIDDPWLFILLAKLKGMETSVRAGEYRLQEKIYTPSLEFAGVEGIMRQLVLKYFERQGVIVRIGRYFPELLLNASECFMCNSVQGVRPIQSINGEKFPIGTITQGLVQTFNNNKNMGSLAAC